MQHQNSPLWDKCLEIIRDTIPEEHYHYWFSPLSFESLTDNVLTISCPSEFFVEQLEDRYARVLKSALDRVFGKGIRLIYTFPIVANDPASKVSMDSAQPSAAVKPGPGASANPFQDKYVEEINSQLNPEYTFENYCISESNKVAQSIGEAIANDPKLKTFNPLFIFGPCGVGKTHLIQAIGIRIKERDPRTRVLYITARLFQDQFSSATLRGKINEFIKFYQSIDTLIIDDIQELIGKEKTQRTFFHIFNHLKQNNKQLIMSSDCAPADMEGMEERLLSRFKSGMTARLDKPDYALRREVLLQKSRRDGIELPEDVVEFIVTNVTQSIREIEGVMVSLLAYATGLNCEIDINLARRVIANSVKLNQRKTNFESITKVVSDYYNIDPAQIFDKSRKREVSDARQMVMYLAKKHTKMPFKTIGARLQRSHATVLYACKLIDERLPLEKKLQEDLSQIERELMAEQ
ncbi:chromosomal replication initiator protein DnaA [uncultured Duncaniella sp.]|uniref:chromosomal replication initiator protein DnaA n=1 Tax=uncultured Duncaniella sp. TaxID=2768039 RepID=UPI0025FF2EED|nr:chromosomal replication initiator protein DnaA [uncultured Duncaniella sp.]